ncbi:DUF935 domain-containing protein [Acidovorax sp. GBBC 3332]|nr:MULTISPECIES: DUF935 family protein [unclassified Acidovorax]MDA8449828.1 DUF935 domain-containing protein [Acidovorax sp. GBBC 3297]MDA8459273.1 DUF935 domain-containing protein [Acidovorax sp. GBBC 3333]MDA8464310.1 DUF935 domain-containing protein [Acidovorax sp. GBBC 3332]MDA8469480.1 DUF935 domain-containing protein [Acidovorax sp. GBBC 3299]
MTTQRSPAKGLYLPDGRFHAFGEASDRRTLTGDAIATRRTAAGAGSGMLGLNLSLLPNPDPVLRKAGKSLQVYRDLRADSHVGGCVRRRKAAVRAMESGLDRGKAQSRVAKSIESILADLDMVSIIGEATDAALYGYQPLEVMWGRVGGLVLPQAVVGKPAEWFGFDADNRLRFRSREGGPAGELVPDRKFLVPRQDASYDNPYGQPDLARTFWATKFKQGGMDFWFRFLEKYGTPWLIGKQPRGSDDGQTEQLLDMLEAMIQDAVAVIPDDSSVEIVEAAGKAGSAEVYREFLLHMRSEVSIALLGQDQTTESDTNHASASAGLEVTADIRDADAGIVGAAINQLIAWTVDLNWHGEAPSWSMWAEDQVNQVMAERDEKLQKAGARFTPQYFQRAYKLQEGDLAPAVPTTTPAPATVSFAEPEVADYADKLAPVLSAQGRATVDGWVQRIRAVVEGAQSLAELPEALVAEFAELDDEQLVQAMTVAFACAQLAGRAEVADGE